MTDRCRGASINAAVSGSAIRSKNGVSLIEMMVAITIFAIAMGYGISFFVFGQKHMTNAKETAFALQLAKDSIEKASQSGYSALAAYSGTVNDSGVTYTRKLQPLEMSIGGEKYKVVSVTVTWQNLQGYSRSTQLRTIVAP